MTSFFTERTAEYALVPILREYLHSRYPTVTPIFYWKTREGNSFSERLHEDIEVRILAMFARRPKLQRDHVVDGKINFELLDYAIDAANVGIPTIAGFPAVQSLFELYERPRIYWLNLSNPREVESRFAVDLSAKEPLPIGESGRVVATMSLPEIAALIDREARLFSWRDAIAHLSELRPAHRTPGLPWFGGYKPVHLLISERQTAATDEKGPRRGRL